MTLEEQFGANVRKYREKAGLSQEELGYRAGLHRTYVSYVERGKYNVQLRTIFKLAAVLDCKPEYLLEGIKLKDKLDK